MDIRIGDLISLVGTFGAGTVLLAIIGLAVWGWMMRTERDYWRGVAISLLSANERGTDALETVAQHVTRKQRK